MRTLVRIVLLWSTFALIGAIVWIPESVNGLDFVLYGGLWVVALWAIREEPSS